MFLGPWVTLESGTKFDRSHIPPSKAYFWPQFCLSEVIALLQPFSGPAKPNKTPELEVGILEQLVLPLQTTIIFSCSSSVYGVYAVLFPSFGKLLLSHSIILIVGPSDRRGITQSSILARLKLPWNFCQNYLGRHSFDTEADKLLGHEFWAMISIRWQILYQSAWATIIQQHRLMAKTIEIYFITVWRLEVQD